MRISRDYESGKNDKTRRSVRSPGLFIGNEHQGMANQKKKRTSASAKSSAGRKRAEKRTSATGRKSSSPVPKSDLSEIILWIMIALSALMFISCIGVGGVFGSYLSTFLFGIFGLVAYVFPIFLLFLTFFLLANPENSFALKRGLGLGLILLDLDIVLELLREGSFPSGALAAMQYARSYHTGGGLIGGFFTAYSVRFLGLAGAYIFVLLLLVISLILVTEKSILDKLREGQSRLSVRAEDTSREYRIRRQIRLEEKKAKREEHLAELEARQTQAMEEAQAAREARRQTSRDAMLHDMTVTDKGTGDGRFSRKAEGVDFKNARVDAPQANQELKTDEVREVHINIFDENDRAQVDRLSLTSQNALSKQPLTIHEEEDAPASNEEVIFHTSKASAVKMDRGSFHTSKASAASRDENPVKLTELNPGSEQDDEDSLGDDYADAQAVSPERLMAKSGSASSDRGRKEIPGADLPGALSSGAAGSLAAIRHEDAALEGSRAKLPREAYSFPPISLLSRDKSGPSGNRRTGLEKTAHKLETVLHNFGVNAHVTDVSVGPAVTRYEIQPEIGVKVSKIVNLADDIKLNMAASDIRIEAPIPGKAAVGIEVPNKETQLVSFRDLMESQEFRREKSNIAFALGRDIGGKVMISNIAKMPHLLIAGATGSGKSVCINTIIMSILYKAHPDDVKFIMIDPKVVELSVYNGIPHLLIPVVTDPKKAAGALNWAVREMTDRYQKFADAGVRDIKGYNSHIRNGKITQVINGQETEVVTEKMPQIVVIVDELADLMMVASSEVEEAICRLAQLARAAGIHLIIATQRPSVNVITGLIKANMPSRVAFAVTSGVDSRTILDMVGAEKLLGKGDMLYFPQGIPKPLRVQGAFVPDDDVARVVDYITSHNEKTQGMEEEIQRQIEENPGMTAIDGNGSPGDDRDPLLEEAGRIIIQSGRATAGGLQRQLKIGFNRAARIMDQLAEEGVIGESEGTKARKVLMSMDEFDQLFPLS